MFFILLFVSLTSPPGAAAFASSSSQIARPSSAAAFASTRQGDGAWRKPTDGLTLSTQHQAAQHFFVRKNGLDSMRLFLSGSDESDKKRRRRRKDGRMPQPPTQKADSLSSPDTSESPPPPSSAVIGPPSPTTKGVVMEVRDVRDIVSGVEGSTPPAESSTSNVKEVADDEDLEEEWEYVDDDEEEDDEYEYVYEDEEGLDSKEAYATRAMGKDESLEQLLRDARKMRAESGESAQVDDEGSIKAKILNLVSTVVTIDFFVVLALLAWFIAGIFCSAVLKDDTVQIAFNSNFQQVTQPALGILMIGSIAGAVFKEEEREEG